MKKSFIYILMAMVMGMVLNSCSAESSNDVVTKGLKPKTSDPDTPQDTTKQDTAKWDVVIGNDLIVNPDNMMATAYLKFVKNGIKDSIWTESWLLDINTEDMTVYRDAYQPTIVKGRTPDAQRSTDPEFKDKYGNMQTRNYYTQRLETNNFTHSISGAWNTAYVLVKGKPEYFWPYYGLDFELNKLEGVGDTIHIVRNDSILALENLDAEYKATLRVDKQSYSRYVYYIKANIKVYSFVGMVEKEPEIPSADWYVKNLTWHAAHGNRFPKGNDWEDGFLMSTDTHWVMLIGHYQIKGNKKSGKEEYISTEVVTMPKGEMATPVADRPYNAVMWDNGKYVPCCLSEDYNFNYGTVYADGTRVTLKPGDLSAVMDGVRNFTEDKTASPSPWLQTSCVPTQYKGKNYFSIVLKSSVHTLTASIADEALKK